MTRYWCTWCGETSEGDTAEERIQCMRCVAEFRHFFGFWPEAAMLPLADGEQPGAPAAAYRRFSFIRPDGTQLGQTWSPESRDERAG